MNMTAQPPSDLVRSPYFSAQGLRTARLLLSSLGRTALILLLSYGSFLLINARVISSVSVDGMSMAPTLRDTDNFFLHRWVYLFHAPRRGDIVVLKDPTDGGLAIKRVIAGPGDAVFVSHGQVFINGKQLTEPYLTEGTPTLMPARFGADLMFGCKADEYFVMGDNRMHSLDSRCYGAVKRQNILGEVFP